MKSWKTPTPEEVAKAIARLAHDQQRRHFFERLDNPYWIGPLRDKGLFKNPLPAIRDEKEGTIGFPTWPQSRYLARMAAEAPEITIETILQVPDIDNTRIFDDFVDAALNVPADLAAKLVPKTLQWLERRPYIQLPTKLGRLVEHLALGDQLKPAVRLARSLLAVAPDPRLTAPGDETKEVSLQPQPRARFADWEYGQILKINIPKLVAKAPRQAHSMLCDLLQDALPLFRKGTTTRSPDDSSQSWRPAVEEHFQNLDRDVKDMLVACVRDASELLASTDAKWVRILVRSFRARNRRSRIFLRLAHHLLRLNPDAAPELVEKTLSSYGNFNRVRVWHEYALLLTECFKRLSPDGQARILDWVSQGPELGPLRKRHQQFFGRAATEDEELKYSNAWRRDHLALIAADLPESWKQIYSHLIEELGPPEFPDFAAHFEGGSWGLETPKSDTDLAKLSLDELIEFLKSWESPKDFVGPSYAGLGRSLQSVVVNSPEKFANAAPQFQVLEPTYVRALIEGLYDAATQKKSFPWVPVLTLCNWVVEQKGEPPEQRRDFSERDSGWGWTRGAVVRLVSRGLETEPTLIPFELRERVWEVLQPLTHDPDPTAQDEGRYAGRDFDAMTLSINTIRGEAMHGVVRYALWVERHFQKEVDGRVRVERGFDEMPEVRKVLEFHLEPENDSSLAVRSVYGRWLPWLVRLDRKWVNERARSLFPIAETHRALRDACWNAYIVSCSPYDDVFNIFRDEYGNACRRIGRKSGPSGHIGDPDERLAEHLMVFYWRGKLDLEQPDSPLGLLYSQASDSLCGRAFVFVGMSLRNTKDQIPKIVLDRLQALWAQRLEIARSSESKATHSAEMAAFGWWFASTKFDDPWSLSQLHEVLMLVGKVEVDHLVVERLAALVEKQPAQVTECLRLMVEGGKDGWAISGWLPQARTVLASALKSGDADASQLAVNLINRFGTLGYFDFRDLLP
jgi:hypothetical protein